MAAAYGKWKDEPYEYAVASREAEVNGTRIERIERNLLDAFISWKNNTWFLRKRLERYALMRNEGNVRLFKGIVKPFRRIKELPHTKTVR